MFVFTLRFLSPKAYDYIRAKFDNNLPHPSTIRRWFLNSNSRGEPGFCQGSLDLLQNLIKEQQSKGEELYCAVVFDEMSIRRAVQWLHSEKKFSGFITYGSVEEESEHLPIASNVLVFIVNGINLRLNLPVAFYFIRQLNGTEKWVLVNSVLKMLADVGVKVLSVGFDGFANNIVLCELAGAKFDVENMRPYFDNPYDSIPVFPIFDQPHMLKLVRNSLHHVKTMYDREGRKIEWRFFESLVQLGQKENFVSHKMTRAHLDLERNKMNVKIAAQTFSNSVASSFKSLMERNHPDFQECTGTIDFTIKINTLFDIMNSDILRPENSYKSPITPSTKSIVFQFLDDMTDYLQKLKLANGKLVINSEKKVGFKGFIVDIANVKLMYTQLVETKVLKTLPVRRLNQDPVESFFGRCRSYSVLGNNTNPTVQQFCAAFRKILVNNEITSSAFANCRDQLDLLYVSSDRPNRNNFSSVSDSRTTPNQQLNNSIEIDSSEIDELGVESDEFRFITSDEISHDDQTRYGIAYAAGCIDKKIESRVEFKCAECQRIISVNEKLQIQSFPKNKNAQIPCKSTFELCSWIYEILKPEVKKMNFNYNAILTKILGRNFSQLYTETDFSTHEHHKEIYIKYIIEEFISMQASYVAKVATLNELTKQVKNKRIKHFQGR